MNFLVLTAYFVSITRSLATVSMTAKIFPMSKIVSVNNIYKTGVFFWCIPLLENLLRFQFSFVNFLFPFWNFHGVFFEWNFELRVTVYVVWLGAPWIDPNQVAGDCLSGIDPRIPIFDPFNIFFFLFDLQNLNFLVLTSFLFKKTFFLEFLKCLINDFDFCT